MAQLIYTSSLIGSVFSKFINFCIQVFLFFLQMCGYKKGLSQNRQVDKIKFVWIIGSEVQAPAFSPHGSRTGNQVTKGN